MRNKVIDPEYTIRGSCPLFACRFCHTKYGWEHQEWCEAYQLTSPSCRDCLYFAQQRNRCERPAPKCTVVSKSKAGAQRLRLADKSIEGAI